VRREGALNTAELDDTVGNSAPSERCACKDSDASRSLRAHWRDDTQLAAASTTASRNREEFCQDEARLYAAPAQLATMWPDVTSTPTVAEAKSMVATLFTLEYLQLADWSIAAPTKTLTNEIYAVGVAAQKQFEEAMFFSPGFNASHSAKPKLVIRP